MTEQTYNYTGGTLTVICPNETIYSGDVNYISFKASTNDVVSATLTIEQGDKVITISQRAISNFLLIDASQIFKNLEHYELSYQNSIDFTFVCKIGNNQVTDTYTFYLIYGRTLVGKLHGSTRTIRFYYVDEGYSDYRIFFFNKGGNTYSILEQGVTLTDVIFDCARYITLTSTLIEMDEVHIFDNGFADNGEYFDAFVKDGYGHFIKLKKCCIPKNAVFLKWRDTDGCTRVTGFKLLSVESGAEGEVYNIDSVERHAVSRNVLCVERFFNLGIDDVEYDEYLQEIIYSDEVTMTYDIFDEYAYNDYPYKVAIDSIDYEQNGETGDLRLRIKLM